MKLFSLSTIHFPLSTPSKFFLLGVAVRLAFIALFPGINYYGLNVFVDVAPWSSGLVHFAYEPFIGRPVGYVLFTAAIWLVSGISPVAIQIAQAIITAFSVVLVYKLALELFSNLDVAQSSRIAKYAALLAAVWPNQARFEIALLPDGLTTLIMLGLALELTRFYKALAWKHLTYAALILAFSIVLRPDLVLFPAFIFVALLIPGIGRKKAESGKWIVDSKGNSVPSPLFTIHFPLSTTLRATAILVIPLAIAIGLNTWKNYALSGEIVPLNLGSGTTMYEGISQFGDTLGTTYADERLAHNVFNTKELFYPHGVEHDRMAWRTAVDTIEHHSFYYATVVLRRIPLLFTVRGLYFSDTVSLSDPKNDLSKRFPGKYIAMFKEHPVQAGVRFLSPLLGWTISSLIAKTCAAGSGKRIGESPK